MLLRDGNLSDVRLETQWSKISLVKIASKYELKFIFKQR